jgi:hypothetical protein
LQKDFDLSQTAASGIRSQASESVSGPIAQLS